MLQPYRFVVRGMVVSLCLFRYPLFEGKSISTHLLPIAGKIWSQLDSWQGKILFLHGGICLVDFVVTSTFVHLFMVHKWHLGLLYSLNKSIWNFVWTGSILKKKLVTVAWDNCCLPKHRGGLGLKILKLFNHYFLA